MSAPFRRQDAGRQAGSKHALIVAPNWIGDCLMTQPFLALLRQRRPEMRLYVLAPSSVAAVYRRMDEVDEIIEHDFGHGGLQLMSRHRLARQLNNKADFDVAYVLPNSWKSALIPWIMDIPLRVGYNGENRLGLLNLRHANPSKRKRPPMTRHYAALAFKPGMMPDKLKNELPLPTLRIYKEEATEILQKFKVDRRRPLVIFCPGAEFGSAKRWPATHFAEVAKLMRHAFPYAQIIVLGSPKDQPIGEAIQSLAPQVQNLCGQTNLDEAINLLSQAYAVVSNDSGLMHITAALKRPLVAIYGSTDPRHTPPLSADATIMWLQLKCSPCFKRDCRYKHTQCLTDIAPDHVFGVIRELLYVPPVQS